MHLEIHVASIYQFETLPQIAEARKNGQFTYEQFRHYQEWFHAEDVFDAAVKEKVASTINEQWHARFAEKENDFMSVTADYLTEAATRGASERLTVSGHTTEDGPETLTVPEAIEISDGGGASSASTSHAYRTYSAECSTTCTSGPRKASSP